MELREKIYLTAQWTHRMKESMRKPALRSDLAAPGVSTKRIFDGIVWHRGEPGSITWSDFDRVLEGMLALRQIRLEALPRIDQPLSLDGLLLAHWPELSDWSGLAVDEADDFFDQGDTPGWDSWIVRGDVETCRQAADMLGRRFVMNDPNYRGQLGPCILAWVPTWLVSKVERAMQCMPSPACEFISN